MLPRLPSIRERQAVFPNSLYPSRPCWAVLGLGLRPHRSLAWRSSWGTGSRASRCSRGGVRRGPDLGGPCSLGARSGPP